MKAMLVYQAGIANVFEVECLNLAPFGRNARLVYQGDFRGAENVAHGMGYAGATVRSAACNEAGNIRARTWSDDLESAPFHTKMHPVCEN